MNDILSYTNYRDYLKDFLSQKKAEKPSFSISRFADRLGFQSRSFISMVIAGKRNLSESSLSKLLPGLELDERERDYFRKLVLYNQAKSEKEKNTNLLQLEKQAQVIMDSRVEVERIDAKEYDPLSDSLTAAIFGLVSTHPIKEDPIQLSSLFIQPQNAQDVRHAINHLIKNGMLLRKDGFLYVGRDLSGTRAKEDRIDAVKRIQKVLLDDAHTFFGTVPLEETVLETVMTAFKSKDAKKYVKMVKDFVHEYNKKTWLNYKKIKSEEPRDCAEASDTIFYILNVQMAPITKKIKK